MLLSVLLVFFVCWTPFQVLQLYNATRPLNEPVRMYLTILGRLYLNFLLKLKLSIVRTRKDYARVIQDSDFPV